MFHFCDVMINSNITGAVLDASKTQNPLAAQHICNLFPRIIHSFRELGIILSLLPLNLQVHCLNCMFSYTRFLTC
jgi:hypothetical protein